MTARALTIGFPFSHIIVGSTLARFAALVVRKGEDAAKPPIAGVVEVSVQRDPEVRPSTVFPYGGVLLSVPFRRPMTSLPRAAAGDAPQVAAVLGLTEYAYVACMVRGVPPLYANWRRGPPLLSLRSLKTDSIVCNCGRRRLIRSTAEMALPRRCSRAPRPSGGVGAFVRCGTRFLKTSLAPRSSLVSPFSYEPMACVPALQAALHVYVNNEGAKKLYAANGWVERKTDSTLKSILMVRTRRTGQRRTTGLGSPLAFRAPLMQQVLVDIAAGEEAAHPHEQAARAPASNVAVAVMTLAMPYREQFFPPVAAHGWVILSNYLVLFSATHAMLGGRAARGRGGGTSSSSQAAHAGCPRGGGRRCHWCFPPVRRGGCWRPQQANSIITTAAAASSFIILSHAPSLL